MSYAFPKITQEQLRERRKQLAEHLGSGWTYTPSDDHHWKDSSISGPNGAQVQITSDRDNKGKVVISGWSENYGEVPRYANEKAPMPSIAVSYERGFDVMRKEMERRFWKDFGFALAAANKYIEEKNGATQRTFDTIKRIETALGKHYNHTRNGSLKEIRDGSSPTIDAGKTDHYDTDISVSSANYITIKLNYLKGEQAVKIAEFLATL
jgi:hypothetical protein